jgi:ABC-type sugar transport system substrate-binding protein
MEGGAWHYRRGLERRALTMKRSSFSRSLAAFALSILLGVGPVVASAADKSGSTPVSYPPNWWVGMRDARLQLMVQGAGIGASEATLDDNPRAKIVKVARGDSPNYLFIDLVAGSTIAMSSST